MITIRAADQRTILAQGPAVREITRRAADVAIERVHIHAADGMALLTVRWRDGSAGTCEWASDRECLDWVRSQAWARGVTRVDFPLLAATV